MRVSIAPACDEELARSEEMHIVGFIKEFVVVLRKDQTRISGACVGKIQVQMLVVARKHFNPDHVQINPSKPGNIVISLVERDFDPCGLAAAGADYAYAHTRI